MGALLDPPPLPPVSPMGKAGKLWGQPGRPGGGPPPKTSAVFPRLFPSGRGAGGPLFYSPVAPFPGGSGGGGPPQHGAGVGSPPGGRLRQGSPRLFGGGIPRAPVGVSETFWRKLEFPLGPKRVSGGPHQKIRWGVNPRVFPVYPGIKNWGAPGKGDGTFFPLAPKGQAGVGNEHPPWSPQKILNVQAKRHIPRKTVHLSAGVWAARTFPFFFAIFFHPARYPPLGRPGTPAENRPKKGPPPPRGFFSRGG